MDIIGGDLPLWSYNCRCGCDRREFSSCAIFHDGVTVRGGSNDVGDADSTSYSDYKRACRY